MAESNANTNRTHAGSPKIYIASMNMCGKRAELPGELTEQPVIKVNVSSVQAKKFTFLIILSTLKITQLCNNYATNIAQVIILLFMI